MRDGVTLKQGGLSFFATGCAEQWERTYDALRFMANTTLSPFRVSTFDVNCPIRLTEQVWQSIFLARSSAHGQWVREITDNDAEIICKAHRFMRESSMAAD